jgi:hypothetical protein
VFQNRVLRQKKIFGPQREEVVGGWRRLHNEVLHSLYVTPNIIRVMESRRMSWTGHVAHMEETRKACMFWSENLKGRDHLEDLK